MVSYELLNWQLPMCPKGLEAFTNSALPPEVEMPHEPGNKASLGDCIFQAMQS